MDATTPHGQDRQEPGAGAEILYESRIDAVDEIKTAKQTVYTLRRNNQELYNRLMSVAMEANKDKVRELKLVFAGIDALI